jgi:hypothetical protein
MLYTFLLCHIPTLTADISFLDLSILVIFDEKYKNDEVSYYADFSTSES